MKPTRSLINGTAVALVVIALAMAVTLCNQDGSRSGTSESVETTIKVSEPADTVVERKSGKQSRRSKRRTAKSDSKTPAVYPERSPLDDPL